MSSARIDLSNKGRGCTPDAGIDRTMPAIMSPYMNDYQWNEFCDKIDGALRPIKRLAKLTMMGFGASFLISIAVFFAFFFSVHKSFSDSPFDEDNTGPPKIALLFILPVLSIILSACSMFYVSAKAQQVLRDIEQICEATSAAQPQLSFHVRYERSLYRTGHDDYNSRTTQYIEVSILQSTVVVPMGSNPIAVGVATPVTTATNTYGGNNNPSSNTVAERLAELDKVKNILSQQEYDSKRAEILASL